MSQTSKIILACVVTALVVAGLLVYFKPSQKFGGTTNLDRLELSEGLGITGGGLQMTSGSINTTGSLNASTTIQSGGVNSTTTPASLTLRASDFTSVSFLSVTPTVASVTMTLPATSTLTTWLPNAGDTTTFTIHNATTTAGINLTLAGGTGTILKNASSTAAIVPLAGATVRAVRKVNTDILFLFTNTN